MNYQLLLTLGCFLFNIGVSVNAESCVVHSNCTTENYVCIDGTCTCYYFGYVEEATKSCLTYATEYNAFCNVTDQCGNFLGSNSECRNNHCVCEKDYRWYKGKCQHYVDKGESCESDDECYNGYDLLALKCSGKKCICNDHYYDRGADCRLLSGFLGGECALNSDCDILLPYCVLGKCSFTKSENHIEIFNEYINGLDGNLEKTNFVFDDLENITCQKDNDCRDIANSLCEISTGRCGCNTQTHYVYEGDCVPGLAACAIDDDCKSGYNNTICFMNASCICQQGFFLYNGKCIAELGMTDSKNEYKEDSECPIKPGKLSDATCYCKNYWFNDQLNRNCIKTMIQSTGSCLTNEWCQAMGQYAFCNSTSNVCECTSNANLNEKTYYCDKVSEPEDICLKDSDCNVNERCLNEKCECIENFSKNSDKDDVCLPDVGGSCEFSSCSHVENSNCVGAVCMCENNYIGKVDRCLKIAEHLRDSCEIDEQCQRIEHTVCGELEDSYEEYDDDPFGNACVCAEDYTAIDGVCYQKKKYGDPCMTEEECTRVLNHSYKCRNSLCQCDVGKILKNGYCTSSGSIIFASRFLLLVIMLKLFVM